MTRAARTSRSHAHQRSGQAALEMALMLPIMLALIFNFLAVMVLVQVRARLSAAASLAAQAAVTAQVGDITDSCIYASSTFFQTALRTQYADSISNYTPCPTTGGQFDSTSTVQNGGALTFSTPFHCSGIDPAAPNGPNYFLGGANYKVTGGSLGPPITCTVTAKLDFNKTALGFAVPWSPSFVLEARSYPSSSRQCASGSGC